ncbi:MAG TPA: lipoprotein signal peptidase [Bacteroidetes bacterium]|nr:lipoprotein signal peptidase [Bacteroidota bacterium]
MLKYLRPVLIILLVLVVDQSLKFWVKLHMQMQSEISITNWFRLYFIENEGMAFGMKWGGDAGKLLLTLFRIIAVVFFSYWLIQLLNKKTHWGLITCVSLIIAGAMGNIIDSIIYGVIFSESYSGGSIAQLFPPDGGYGALLHGKVVDMLYFPIIKGVLPQWIPIWGGEYFVFFSPIFNVADFSISTGVIALLVFQKKFFKKNTGETDESKSETISDEGNKETTDDVGSVSN